MRTTRFLAPLLSWSVVLCSIPSAEARLAPSPPGNPSEADVARAREFYENGRQLYLDGSYDSAVAAFNQAYALSGDPILLYNIAQAYDRMDSFEQALEYLEAYRVYAPAEEREALGEKVESLRRRQLKAESEQKARAEEEPALAEPDEDAPAPEPSANAPQDQPKIFTPLAISLTAVAAVGLGTGLGLGLASRSRRQSAEDLCGVDPVICSEDAESDLDASGNFAIGADISFAVGAAALVGAAVVIGLNVRKRQQNADESATARRGQNQRLVEVQPRVGGVQLRF